MNKKLQFLFILFFILVCLFCPDKLVISKDNDEDNILEDSLSNKLNELPISYTIDLIPNITLDENLIKAGLLYDVKQNKIVWEKKMHDFFPIASLTKMMVGLLAIEDLKAGKIQWNTPVKVTKQASYIGGSRIYLGHGTVTTIKKLLNSSLIVSANNACYLLAQFLGGTEKEFVKRMNERAAQLGMKTTLFSNSTGLPTPSIVTDNHASPYDLLILANELLKHEEILEIAAQCEESVCAGKKNYSYKNHNRLVIEYKDEIDGLKTGFTNNAGYCIVVTANRGNHRVINIVLGVQKSWVIRNKVVSSMLNNYYSVIGLGRLGEEIKTTVAPVIVEETESSE